MSSNIKVTIDPVKGLVQKVDSTGGFVIIPSAGNQGFSPAVPPGAPSDPTDGTQAVYGLAFTASVPGFYLVSGSTACTGTLPAPKSVPGTYFMFTLWNTQPLMLTGSARTGTGGVFSTNGVVNAITGSARGDSLDIVAGGSINLYSDGFYYVPVCSSGTLKIHA